MSVPSQRQQPAPLAVYEYADDRLRSLIELQLQRAHELEQQDLGLQRTGLIFGLVVTMAFLVAAVFLVYSGHDTAGTIIGSVDLVALVTIFVVRRRQ